MITIIVYDSNNYIIDIKLIDEKISPPESFVCGKFSVVIYNTNGISKQILRRQTNVTYISECI